MFKYTFRRVIAMMILFAFAFCGTAVAEEAAPEVVADEAVAAAEGAALEVVADEAVAGIEEAVSEAVPADLAEDRDALIDTYPQQFTLQNYEDAETGLSITYNLYLPEDYDADASYPMVVFIGDSSCVGSDTYSLTQGRGALVWATQEWQAACPTIVAVPTYPVTILDDHGSYTTTEYVELTARFIRYMCAQYAVDESRVYGTGQSMGCMTTLILAAEYPDLYAACMFVDGQWDISTLAGLQEQTFVYFAAEDDVNAWNGAQEVMAMFDGSGTSYAYAQWDGNWTPDELSAAAQALFREDENQYFISWLTGTIEPKSGGMGGPGGAGGGGGNGESAEGESEGGESAEGESAGNAAAEGESAEGESAGNAAEGGSPEGESAGNAAAEGESAEGESAGNAAAGGMDSSAYHMASFDYAYNCVAVMQWLFRNSW